MIEALRRYAIFLEEVPREKGTNVELVLMPNDKNDPQFILFLKNNDDNTGLRTIRRFRELGMPIQSEPLTEVMATYCQRTARDPYAIFSFIPDPTRIADIIHADAVGKAFARDVMSKLPKEFFK